MTDLVKRLRSPTEHEAWLWSVPYQAADRIEKLELRSEQWKATATTIENERLVMKDRIEELESALRGLVVTLNSNEIPYMVRNRYASAVAEQALEGKDD